MCQEDENESQSIGCGAGQLVGREDDNRGSAKVQVRLNCGYFSLDSL